MKNLQQIRTGRAGIIGMICLLAAAFSSCSKVHNDDIVVTPSALISVVDACPDAGSLDFFLDNNMANTNPIVYGNGLDYLRAYTGKRTATFYVSGTSQKIKTDTMTLKDGKFYTLFLSNVASKADYLLTIDTLTNPGTTNTQIRLVNLSPDAPAVDLAIQGGATVATNRAYRTISSFSTITPNTYTLEVRQKGTTTVLASIPGVKLYGASLYTVWLQGSAASSTLAAKLQLNAYYY
ncbi:MAG: DUF4397 domain-containing protein [Mucilaginibacter sp.]|uniref:DUF4397 domain-containing protein n=1 Tax=Mucilaginibacter sp. TaxID=1882438 RepID=UPI003263C66C